MTCPSLFKTRRRKADAQMQRNPQRHRRYMTDYESATGLSLANGVMFASALWGRAWKHKFTRHGA